MMKELELTDYSCPWCLAPIYVNTHDIASCKNCSFRRPKEVFDEFQ